MIILITVDADWALPEVTEHALARLRRRGVPFTFFATEDQRVTPDGMCEVALHPNLQRGTAREELGALKAIYPEARGLRPHRLDRRGLDGALLEEFGLCWTSIASDPDRMRFEPLYGQRPDVAINWGDNWWFTARRAPRWDILGSAAPGVYLVNFHPVHVFLNTFEPRQYEQAKQRYHDIDWLGRHRNDTETGVADVLEQILETGLRAGARFMRISDALAETT